MRRGRARDCARHSLNFDETSGTCPPPLPSYTVALLLNLRSDTASRVRSYPAPTRDNNEPVVLAVCFPHRSLQQHHSSSPPPVTCSGPLRPVYDIPRFREKSTTNSRRPSSNPDSSGPRPRWRLHPPPNPFPRLAPSTNPLLERGPTGDTEHKASSNTISTN